MSFGTEGQATMLSKNRMEVDSLEDLVHRTVLQLQAQVKLLLKQPAMAKRVKRMTTSFSKNSLL